MLKEIIISVLVSMICPNISSTANGNNNRSPVTDTWQKIVMVYYHDFPCREHCQRKGVTGCIRIHNGTDKWALRCREQVNLLRPGKVVSIWRQVEKKKGYIALNIPEFSLKDVHAWIIATDHIHENHFPVTSSNTGYVTGIFKRHIMNINGYAFKNLKTGAVSFINVTPGHRFYVENKKSFIPVSQVASSDTLINSSGEKIKLACLSKNEQHCNFSEESVNAGTLPVQVYNLEVHGKSCYFSGKEKILVHNICALAREIQDKLPHLVVTKGFLRWKRFYLRLNSPDDVNRTWDVLQQSYPKEVGCEVCSTLTAYEYTGEKVKIASLQKFLLAKKKLLSGRDSAARCSSALNDILKPFGARVQVAEISMPASQQILGEDEGGAALIYGGSYIGFVRGEGPGRYYYKAIIRTEDLQTNYLQEKQLFNTDLVLEDWGLHHLGSTWHIKFFIPLERR